MSAPIRWNYAATVSWDPILPFASRRDSFLEWTVANVRFSSFLDDGPTVGIELGDGVRIRFDRRSLVVEVLRPDANLGDLAPVLEGLQEHLRPQGVCIQFFSLAWSMAIEGDYDKLRKRLAKRSTPIDWPPGAVLEDCAVLTTFTLERVPSQAAVEYGLVSAEELSQRVSDPHMGMMQSQSTRAESPPPNPETLPSVSVFANAAVTVYAPTALVGAPDVIDGICDDVDSVMVLIHGSIVNPTDDPPGG